MKRSTLSKQMIAALALTFGCSAAYSGTSNTMYIRGVHNTFFVKELKALYNITYSRGTFNVEVEDLPVRGLIKSITEDHLRTLQSNKKAAGRLFQEVKVSGTKIDSAFTEEVPDVVTNGYYATEPLNTPSLEVLQSPMDESKSIFEVKDEAKNAVSEATPKEIDAFLIANPIDRSQKNCYVETAERFGKKSDYIRDRYRKLREKGFVENENN